MRPAATSPFFLTCEHAGRAFPDRLGTLGLAAPDLERQIAWDIGAAALARGLSARVDAAIIAQRYSRLVVDCNRAPAAADFVVEVSEDTPIPGNRGLSEAAIEARAAAIFHPYHEPTEFGMGVRHGLRDERDATHNTIRRRCPP